ncbi:hypothetical protein SCWH03_57850 [Streptomyces pacificus]|uniref:Uncharacterized protein n=1 Tax=Streptomyces pacificus TaxID=2705029 RepID=A0A6A0B6Z6_9ACTN|nr:hypothetical protein SCWH03_57850 [Streptomyces pacificus]
MRPVPDATDGPKVSFRLSTRKSYDSIETCKWADGDARYPAPAAQEVLHLRAAAAPAAGREHEDVTAALGAL